MLLCKTTSSWSKGTAATLAVYGGTPLSEAATGDTITAYNKFAAIGSDKFVAVGSIAGNWYLVAAECS